MSGNVTTAFWSMTLNNYDDRDLALVRNGYPDHMRELIYTLEQGESGTPHIQAWLKLQRQQRISFVRKLFPGGHFKPLTNDEYTLNTKLYAQKDDTTTRSAHVHTYNDPIPTIESLMKRVFQWIHREWNDFYSDEGLYQYREQAEKALVRQDYRLAKIFVSATYKAMWKDFGPQMYDSFVHTHTHTHTAEIFSHVETTTNGGESRIRSTQDSEVCSQADGSESNGSVPSQGSADSAGARSP